jgi:DNA-binding transcriptional MocR family regulator
VSVHLPRGVDEVGFRERAASDGVALGDYRDYWADPTTAPAGLLIGFGSISTDDLPEALARVGQALRSSARDR